MRVMKPHMKKILLLTAAFAITTIASSQAHCGSCDHKDDKKGDKKGSEKKELVTEVQP